MCAGRQPAAVHAKVLWQISCTSESWQKSRACLLGMCRHPVPCAHVGLCATCAATLCASHPVPCAHAALRCVCRHPVRTPPCAMCVCVPPCAPCTHHPVLFVHAGPHFGGAPRQQDPGSPSHPDTTPHTWGGGSLEGSPAGSPTALHHPLPSADCGPLGPLRQHGAYSVYASDPGSEAGLRAGYTGARYAQRDARRRLQSIGGGRGEEGANDLDGAAGPQQSPGGLDAHGGSPIRITSHARGTAGLRGGSMELGGLVRGARGSISTAALLQLGRGSGKVAGGSAARSHWTPPHKVRRACTAGGPLVSSAGSVCCLVCPVVASASGAHLAATGSICSCRRCWRESQEACWPA